jgi:hypothetical protein
MQDFYQLCLFQGLGETWSIWAHYLAKINPDKDGQGFLDGRGTGNLSSACNAHQGSVTLDD